MLTFGTPSKSSGRQHGTPNRPSGAQNLNCASLRACLFSVLSLGCVLVNFWVALGIFLQRFGINFTYILYEKLDRNMHSRTPKQR